MSESSLGATLLRRWRDDHGLNQTKGAEELGISQPTLSDWESGRKLPRMQHAARIQEKTGGEVPVESWAKPAPEPLSDDSGSVKSEPEKGAA